MRKDKKMLFKIFNSQEERKKYGGSAFIEIQFCRLPMETNIKDIVAVDRICHWQNDSLYVYIDNINVFYKEYSRIFNCGIYNNLKKGGIDIYGINYYDLPHIDSMIETLFMEKPVDYETLAEWLNRARAYNGFYILGI